jgi:hypothetical protein
MIRPGLGVSRTAQVLNGDSALMPVTIVTGTARWGFVERTFQIASVRLNGWHSRLSRLINVRPGRSDRSYTKEGVLWN